MFGGLGFHLDFLPPFGSKPLAPWCQGILIMAWILRSWLLRMAKEHRLYPARGCSRATIGFSPQLSQTECPLGILREVGEAMGVSGPDDSHATMMGNVRRSRLATGSSALFGACLMILFLPLVSLRAQPTAAIYNISGVVLDPSGSFVPGASVRLHQQSATIAQARTQKADGRFSFPDIPPGAYTVQVLEDEFELQEVAVLIEDSDPKPLSIVLVLRELQQALTVYDSDDEVNTSIPGNSSAVTLDLDTLEGIPVMDDDIIGAVTDLVENITGETARIVVDGMPASGSGISPAEIKEIKINKDPYSAEYSGPGSGRVEITTKGGSKSFHGSLGFGLRDYRMDARNAFALDRPTTQRRVYSGDFSGPLSKSGKTTFIATMWRKEEDQRPIVNALTLEGAVRENVPKRTESTTLSGKVRSALSDNNIISLQYRFVDWTAKGELVGGFSLPEAGADYLVRKHVLRYDHTTILSPNLVNRFTVSGVTSETIIQSLNPGVRKTVVLQAFTAGGSQVDGTHSTDNIGLSNVTSWRKVGIPRRPALMFRLWTGTLATIVETLTAHITSRL